MKRKALLWLLLFLLAIGGYAGEVTKSDAKIVALNWLNSHSELFYYEKDITKIDLLEEDEASLIYLVSFSPKGWVMVSGVDKTEPVLGYSDSSVFDTRKMPVQLKGWIDGLEEELRKASSDDYYPSNETEDRWHYFKSADLDMQQLKSLQSTSAGPLLSITWDQGRYFNEMAPFDINSSAGNDHVWIGCVATAMAQIMKYWEYPVNGTGSKSYNHPDYGIQSADFENTTYNWASMPDNLTEENEAVQKLNYHAAVAVEMDFGPNGSGASTSDASDALSDYFKYNFTSLSVDKNEWDSEAEWKEVLKSEIDNGRPVIYSGYNWSQSSGHAFICDGYSSGDYFHFNWGWGGYGNGNFLLSSLTPYDRNYSTNQSAIMGIEPIEVASIATPYINGFESGKGEFSLFGKSKVSVAESHTGSYSIQLSSEGFSSKSKNVASMTFEVPADGMIDFWVKRYTPESSGYNIQKAILYSQYGSESLISFFKGDFNDSGWVNYYADISAYEGQIVRLMFIQENLDPAKEQWMYVDDVAITGGSTNLPPYRPGSPSPADDAVSVSLSPLLQWTGGDPNGDDLLYWIYFDKSSGKTLNSSTFYNYKRLTGLEPMTTYFWKIVARDEEEATSSDVWSFTTRGLPPDVESCGMVSVTSGSAVLCGQIIDDNGSVIIERGVWWDSYPNPQQSDNEQLSNDAADVFEVEITGLEPYKTYFAKPFAQSDEGYGVGEEFQFRTAPDKPEVNFVHVQNVKRNSAEITGLISDINDSIISRRGVVWSINENFSSQDTTIVGEEGAWDINGDFSLLIDNIPGPDTIYFKVFAENSVGISYSDKNFFVTKNLPPEVDLDADNSSGENGNNYSFFLIEQYEGGMIADADIEIGDADGDIMQKVIITLDKQLDDEKEYLIFTGNTDNVVVYGNLSDSLAIERSDAISNLWWSNIIRDVEYRNDSDAPDSDFIREVKVWVNDGYENSFSSLTMVSMIPENDAPVSLQTPSLSTLPVFNEYSSGIVPGVWSDSLDNSSNAEFEYSYRWEVNYGDTIKMIEGSSDSLFIDESLCGTSLRVLETALDINSGGDNQVSAQHYSEWFEVQKAEQEVVEFEVEGYKEVIPAVEYRDEPYLLTGIASSGLPLTYDTFEEDYFEISGDSLFVKSIGAGIVFAYQKGNSCYYESEEKYKNINVVKGNQKLVVEMDSVYLYTDDLIDISVYSTASLNVQAESLDTTVLKVNGEHAVIKETGQCQLILSQPGNDYYKAADTLSFLVTIEKGVQIVDAPDTIKKRYNDEPFRLPVQTNTGLDVDYVVDENDVVSFEDSLFSIYGVGETEIVVEQEGNANWLPVTDTVYCIINKGMQDIAFNSLVTASFGEEKIPLQAVSTSGLVVRYEVSDDSVAQIEGDSLLIKGAGDVFVVAYQDGDDNWMAATPVEQYLIIDKASQIITTTLADSITTRQHITYDDFSSSSGLNIFEIESSDDAIIRVYEDSIVVNDRGAVVLTVTQPGNKNYLEATGVFEFYISNPLNIEEFESIALDLFPNPADDKLHVVIEGDIQLPLDFSLLNLLGQVHMTDRITKQFQVVDIGEIETGTYIVLLRNKEYYLTQKIIVK